MPLRQNINCSLLTGIVPSNFKIAKVVPIYINGKRDDPCNCRPVSILPGFSKILVKLIANLLFAFLKNNIIYEYQFGFTPGRNTIHAKLSLVDYIINSFENNNIGCGIFLDISKAFDTMDHSILLGILGKYGIRGIALKWFNSYLSEGYQYVSLDTSLSSLKKRMWSASRIHIRTYSFLTMY